jgi:hypothetical protein
MMGAMAEAAQVESATSEIVMVDRSPADVLRLMVASATCIVLLLVGVLFDDAIVGFVSDLVRGLDSLPNWFVVSIGVGARVLFLAMIVGGLVLAMVRGRWRMLLTIAVGAAIASVLFLVADPLVDHTEAPAATIEELDAFFAEPGFPGGLTVAVVTAAVAAGSPWFPRRWRRIGWLLVLLLATTRLMVAPLSFETSLAVVAGWLGGAVAVVALGAPVRRSTPAQVSDGLGAVGVSLTSLEKAGVDARGSTPYFGVDVDGHKLFVKALGADERSADLLFRMYRAVLPRDLGDEKPFSTLRRAVEHEALVALAARDMGIRTPRLAGFATVEPDGFVLAYEAIAGRSFDRLEIDEVTDAVLGAVWAQVGELRAHRIAHRDLRLANIFLSDEGEVWMIDFGFSELSASDLLLTTDLAELLASSSLQVGVDRAVAAGLASVGVEALRSALPRLDTRYLSGATRTGMKEDPTLMPALRSAVGRV